MVHREAPSKLFWCFSYCTRLSERQCRSFCKQVALITWPAEVLVRGLAEGLPRRIAAWLGPTKLATAIFFATLTNIIAYLPFLMLSGNSLRPFTIWERSGSSRSSMNNSCHLGGIGRTPCQGANSRHQSKL